VRGEVRGESQRDRELTWGTPVRAAWPEGVGRRRNRRRRLGYLQRKRRRRLEAIGVDSFNGETKDGEAHLLGTSAEQGAVRNSGLGGGHGGAALLLGGEHGKKRKGGGEKQMELGLLGGAAASFL
jgi:hypothetical protein